MKMGIFFNDYRRKTTAIVSLLIVSSMILSSDGGCLNKYRKGNETPKIQQVAPGTIEEQVTSADVPSVPQIEEDLFLDTFCKNLDYLLAHPVKCVGNYFDNMRGE